MGVVGHEQVSGYGGREGGVGDGIFMTPSSIKFFVTKCPTVFLLLHQILCASVSS